MTKSSKHGGSRGRAVQTHAGAETPNGSPRAVLIRIPQREARERAITAFLQVREPRCGFTDHRMLVTRQHIEVLLREGIPFETLSEPSQPDAP
jgi:hypothetical protein